MLCGADAGRDVGQPAAAALVRAVAGSGQHGHHRDVARNVLGGELESCGTDPMTGFHRDGCCNTAAEDAGVHTVCAVVTAEFLRFSTGVGNDLVTPRPEFG